MDFIDMIESAISSTLILIVKSKLGSSGVRPFVLFTPCYIWRRTTNYYIDSSGFGVDNPPRKMYNMKPNDLNEVYRSTGKNTLFKFNLNKFSHSPYPIYIFDSVDIPTLKKGFNNGND